MALQIGHELVGPGTVQVNATQYGNVGAGSGGAPMWEVGNPVAIAMSGLQNAVANFADTYDDVQVSDFLLRKEQELDQKYNHPETGLFATRRGGNARGIYNELVADAKRITDEDAPKELNARQRGKITKPLSTLFTKWGHTVGGFETEQLMAHQSQMIDNNIAMAKDLVARNGNLDNDALGNALAQISINIEAKGKTLGWDAETIKRNAREAFGEAITKGAVAKSISDPTAAYGALVSYKDIIPEERYQAAIKQVVAQWNENTGQQFFDIYENQGEKPAREFIRSVSMAGRSANRTANAESGGDPSKVWIVDDKNISVGLYQFHKGPKFDMINKFGEYLSKQGKPEVAAALKGKSGKELGKAWELLVKEGKITEEEQTAFAQEMLVDPTMKALPSELQERINNSSTYQDALWSTAIQHGQGAATRLLKSAWNDSGTDNRKFFESLYDSRKGQFGSSTPSIRKAVQQRLEKEKQRAIGELITDAAGVSDYRRDELVLKPQKVYQYNKMMETRSREKSVEANRLWRDVAPNAFATFVQTGDASFMDETEQALIQTGDEKRFTQFKTQRQWYEELLPFMKANEEKSFAEQKFLALQMLDGFRERTGEGADAVSNAAQIQKMANDLGKIFDSREAEFLKSPNKSVTNMRQARAVRDQQDPTIPPAPESKEGQDPRQKAQNQWLQDIESGKAAAEHADIMRQQIRISGDPNFIPTAMNEDRAKEYRDKLEAASRGENVQATYEELTWVAREFGGNANKVFSELKMSGGARQAITSAVELGPEGESLARKLFAISVTPDPKVWAVNEKSKQEWLDKARKNPIVVYATTAMQMSGFGGITDTEGLITDVAKWIALGGEEDAKKLADMYSTYNNSQYNISKALGMLPVYGNVALMLPKNQGVDAQSAAYALARYTYRLEDVLPKGLSEQQINGIKQGSTWISTSNGYAVMYKDGLKVLDNSQNPIAVNLKDLVKKHPIPTTKIPFSIFSPAETETTPEGLPRDSEFFGTGIYAPSTFGQE